MGADCHMHMILDGYQWKNAIARHREKPDEAFIRQILSHYQELGYTYLRDGGDRWGASGPENWQGSTVLPTAYPYLLCIRWVTTADSSAPAGRPYQSMPVWW